MIERSQLFKAIYAHGKILRRLFVLLPSLQCAMEEPSNSRLTLTGGSDFPLKPAAQRQLSDRFVLISHTNSTESMSMLLSMKFFVPLCLFVNNNIVHPLHDLNLSERERCLLVAATLLGNGIVILAFHSRENGDDMRTPFRRRFRPCKSGPTGALP